MNAAKYYGTQADFLIVCDESIPESVKDSYTNAFPFQVRWFHLHNWLECHNVPLNKIMSKYWIAPWIVASEMVEEYDAVCILQADEFLVVNVNHWFEIAAKLDKVIISEWTCSNLEFEDLPFGKYQADDEVGEIALFDQLVFINKTNKQVLIDTYKQQIAAPDAEVTQVNHPMGSLCRACVKHLNKDKIIGLDGHTWCWDRDEFEFRITWTGEKFYNERKIKVNGIHCKVWKEGLDQAALDRYRAEGDTVRNKLEIGLHNFTTIKDVMIKFNEMTPAVKQENYCKERFR